jgi:hypothetical protein
MQAYVEFDKRYMWGLKRWPPLIRAFSAGLREKLSPGALPQANMNCAVGATQILFSKPPYSMRNARIGLMRVARRAGSHVAMSAAVASKIGAMVNAMGSSAPTS